ncbi:DUF7019 family protein [Amycolatopsis suaedae]|uniref:Uncharacterized protein n=1 Tax=Amycolatopsis suaedae TaxID=2510978 RepID=A0A4Q7JBN2_9PSEU|nr:SAVMC3_10250 family protein [Amycolatopsis suaedae]RZQ63903.1 hypothetical protein EWH70_12210 [Amycolatopsis suaedae]
MAKQSGRGKHHLPKYYLYISSTKVDNLLPQIPAKFVKSFETEIKVNAGMLSATVREKPAGEQAEISKKVGLLSAYLEREERIGSIALPDRYIKDVASLQYGVVAEYASDIAFFGGYVNGVKLGLIGASSSLVGSVSSSEANHAPYYYTLKFLNGLAQFDGNVSGGPPYCSYSEAVDIALRALPPVTSRVEFLARTLYSKSDVIVATPIYVALAD